MAGGWGAPIQAPMRLVKNPIIRSFGNPGLPALGGLDLPEITIAAGSKKPAKPAMPAMVQAGAMSNVEAQEAADYARDVGVAFAYSKAQKKIGSKRARARGRAADYRAKRIGKAQRKTGRQLAARDKEMMYRTALNEARIRGTGADIFKRAKL